MKKRKTRPWKNSLRQTLLKKLPPAVDTRNLLSGDHQRAVKEITRGVEFCVSNGLNIQVTLSSTFDIGNRCKCLFAKNSPEHDYDEVLLRLHINNLEASRMGFTGIFSSVIGLEWKALFNTLWRRTGRFFRDRPGYRVR